MRRRGVAGRWDPTVPGYKLSCQLDNVKVQHGETFRDMDLRKDDIRRAATMYSMDAFQCRAIRD